jgi:hypothetical protein
VLSQKIAEFALEKNTRNAILERNRRLLNSNVELMQDWVDFWDGRMKFVKPQGGGVAFLRYDMDMNSSILSEKLRKDFGVFIAAGDWFGMDNFIRIGIGAEKSYLEEGLGILRNGIQKICGI